MGNFADVLIETGRRKSSVLVVGLDPDVRFFPDFLAERAGGSARRASEAIYEFNKIVIDSAADSVIAVKPQLAYYEIYGSDGMRALEKTIDYAKSRDLIVINDAKRGDIGPTSAAYARAFLGTDRWRGYGDRKSLSGNGRLHAFHRSRRGERQGRVFAVENIQSFFGEIQGAKLESGQTLCLEMAERFHRLAGRTRGVNGFSYIGAVVGATYPEEAQILRKTMPSSIFLVPGFGAQGGKAEDLGRSSIKTGTARLCRRREESFTVMRTTGIGKKRRKAKCAGG
ncbi:orotidine-5'-phosphate decarboxylase [Cohnella algarum]|uniref:orotidine-5'-phosphate decarboxylase n=1 Tax=Cohnella algarum TaxID=2044859 RepID=UPI0019683722|nr:orotidine-5'-phosphate decarboxylase [Cohnella algarum]MBN2982523.1 orotidine-5'-phosphate decarboxylase [Cohnella algarum]